MGYRVAVVGATGLVGETMIRSLEERGFPVDELHPYASEASRGQSVTFRGSPVEVLGLDRLKKTDLALFSAGSMISRVNAHRFMEMGALVVDNTRAFRMEPAVPLVVPEVNPEAIRQHKGIVANPNCSTIQVAVALAPLHHAFDVDWVSVVTLQSVSGAGRSALETLLSEARGETPDLSPFQRPIHGNLIPQIGAFKAGYAEEEWKLMQETRKILQDRDLVLSATCVRVPVRVVHSASVTVRFKSPVTLERIVEKLRDARGLVLLGGAYVSPLEVEGRDEVFCGRVRTHPDAPDVLEMWVVADNLRKGAATNAVQIAEIALGVESP
jgi:aspartate-semialdehyde dehydrogenase